MLTLIEAPFRTIILSWHPLRSTLWDEVWRKNAGSAFGIAWIFLLPVLFLGLYSATYLIIFKVKPANMTPTDYVLFVYIGLLPFLSFSESLGSGVAALMTNRSVLLNTVFPVELLPLRTVLAAQTTMLVGMAICLVWSGLTGHLTVWVLLLPVIVAAQTMFLTGAAWLLAPIYVVFRDIGQIINFVVLAMMIISPIAYRAADLDSLGTAWLLARINPLFYYLISYQSVLFDGVPPPGFALPIAMLLGIVVFMTGFAFCNRIKVVIADYV